MSKKILISVPLSPYSRMEPQLVKWILKMVTYYNFQNPGKFVIDLDLVEGKPIDSARNNAVNRFLKTDNDYFMAIDADIVPPDNCIEELMNHQVEVIGATVYSFQYGYPFAVILNKSKEDNGYKQAELNGHRLHECDATGAACMIIKRNVLAEMKEYLLKKNGKTMFYETHYSSNGELSWGQDFWFCENVLALGYKIYIDLKIHCGHFVDRVDLRRINHILSEEQQKVYARDRTIAELKNKNSSSNQPLFNHLQLPLFNEKVST